MSEPAKECVTTHLPKVLALKMDGAKASHLYPTVFAEQSPCGPNAKTSRKVAGVAQKPFECELGWSRPWCRSW